MAEFECPICEEEFTLKWHLQQHFRRYHRKHKMVKCGMCKMIFIKKKPISESAGEATERLCKHIDRLGEQYSRRLQSSSPFAIPIHERQADV